MRVRAFLLAVLALALFPMTAAANYPHVVQPGETLTSVAATDGLSIDAIAQANGISPEAELVAGQVLWIPPRTAPYATAADATTTTTAAVSPQTQTHPQTQSTTEETSYTRASPQPTDERVSPAEIADVAGEYGVPAAFAEAIAWQESGWNNAEVSGIGAVGVMQIVPSTWDWIDRYLTPSTPLGTDSAAENVRAGVLMLHQLLGLTDGNESLAAAGYFQGLASVQKYGMYADTRQYVADVMALAQRL
jgi:N-acetylmuramoyl-L-alanine amidase